MKVGLALGSGGARGFAHLGVIRVLQEAGIPIDCIVGASAGSIVGSYLALYETIEPFQKHLMKMSKREYIGVFNINFPRHSILGNEGPRKFLKQFFGNKNIEDTKIPLAMVATDYYTGKDVLLQKGNIVDGILASSAIPGILPPVVIDKRLLIDGGVVNPVPLSAAEKIGADIVIGVDLTSDDDRERWKFTGSIPNIYEIIDNSFSLIRTETARYSQQKTKKPFVIIRPNLRTLGAFSFYEGKRVIKSGEDAARSLLPEIQRIINEK